MIKHFLHFIKASKFSINGIITAFKNEIAFRQEIIILIIILPIVYLLSIPLQQKALLISSWLLVLVVELINSAIESVVDKTGLEENQLSKNAKDFGSAAVAVAVIIALIIWIGILF